MLGSMFEARIPLLAAVGIACFACVLQATVRIGLLDPLVIALILGIAVRMLAGSRGDLARGAALATRLFIPFGIAFYALENINFARVAAMRPATGALVALVMLVYFGVVLLLGRLLAQRRQITYLVATGSAVCGASAIAMTSAAVEAEPDDVSISLLAVTLAALLGLFVLLPFLALLLHLSGESYGLLAGSVLQFTGFVREAMVRMPHLPAGATGPDLVGFALTVKAGRYFGLFIAIPLFASLLRRKVCFPRFLWLFLAAGLLGTWLATVLSGPYARALGLWVHPLYQVSWALAMAAIGMSADVKRLLSDEGVKAFWMATGGLTAALAAFFAGLQVVQQI